MIGHRVIVQSPEIGSRRGTVVDRLTLMETDGTRTRAWVVDLDFERGFVVPALALDRHVFPLADIDEGRVAAGSAAVC